MKAAGSGSAPERLCPCVERGSRFASPAPAAAPVVMTREPGGDNDNVNTTAAGQRQAVAASIASAAKRHAQRSGPAQCFDAGRAKARWAPRWGRCYDQVATLPDTAFNRANLLWNTVRVLRQPQAEPVHGDNEYGYGNSNVAVNVLNYANDNVAVNVLNYAVGRDIDGIPGMISIGFGGGGASGAGVLLRGQPLLKSTDYTLFGAEEDSGESVSATPTPYARNGDLVYGAALRFNSDFLMWRNEEPPAPVLS